MCTFPHGLLFLYRLLLFAQVILVQGLLLKADKDSHQFVTVARLKVLNVAEITSPAAVVGPRIAVWPAYPGTELSEVGRTTNFNQMS